MPSGVLEDNSFETDRITHFVKKFELHRSALRVLLRRTGFGLPHVTDVDWKLDYYMKSNQLEKINEPQFTLQFATEVGHARQCPVLSTAVCHRGFTFRSPSLSTTLGSVRGRLACLAPVAQNTRPPLEPTIGAP